jgi:CBS domain containing-hemolysin-like protein
MGVNDAALLLETTWETDASTVGGLVTEALGHIPSEGDTTVVGGFEFGVERVKDRIPQSVVARRVVPVSSEEAR